MQLREIPPVLRTVWDDSFSCHLISKNISSLVGLMLFHRGVGLDDMISNVWQNWESDIRGWVFDVRISNVLHLPVMSKINSSSLWEVKRPKDIRICKASGFNPARDMNSSVLKGIWWMPWRLKAMKDVAGCDKPRLEVNTLWPGDFRMGKPTFWLLY